MSEISLNRTCHVLFKSFFSWRIEKTKLIEMNKEQFKHGNKKRIQSGVFDSGTISGC
jgi:hypothetical protein